MKKLQQAPLKRSYWVVDGQFLAGYYPGDPNPIETETKMKAILDSGIRCFINLMEADEMDYSGKKFIDYRSQLKQLSEKSGVKTTCLRFPIRDIDVPTIRFMVEILDTIDSCLQADKPVYVHCRGGIGRTGTVVGCYLVRHGLCNTENVLKTIRELRGNDPMVNIESPETGTQKKMIENWERGM